MSARRTSAPTLLSLFTGAGGLDIGLEIAGFETLAAVDSDEDCAETLKQNQAARIANAPKRFRTFLEKAKIMCARVEDLRPDDIRPESAPADWVPDLLAGGPPCQPFSSAGNQKGFDDPRGRLFQDFVRLAKGLQPKIVLLENVRGLVTAPGPSGEPGEALALVRDAFERIGYATRFSVLNAADFGLPQRRVRMFMLATRGSPLPQFPTPTHAEEPQQGLLGCTVRWVSLREFLEQHPEARPEEIVRPTPRLQELLSGLPAGAGLKSPGARETTRPGGHWGYKQGTFIADLNLPARTVTAASTQDWIRWKGELRRLTLSECAGLQGFPSSWKFAGPKASQFRQVGNAVPVLFGRVLGAQIIRALEGWRSERTRSAPWPSEFKLAVEYTKRERHRNGQSREAVKAAVAASRSAALELKGLGG